MENKRPAVLNFILKGISFDSEESQFILMMRLYYIITALYIVSFYIFAGVHGILAAQPVLLIWLPLHIACFFTTYRCGRRLTFHIFSGGILTWLIYSVVLMGADYGAHYFIYPLMVISFFATYRNFWGKAAYMTFLLALNIWLYFFGKTHVPILDITDEQGDIIHIMYTVTLFVCMFVICFIFSNTNQSALEKLSVYNRRLKKEAETDALTGLMNRRCMYKALEENMGVKNAVFSVAIGDIDFFKKINDTKGHNFGDEVLRCISEYFMEYMDEKGIVCRWGGEEFLFLFPSCGLDKAYEYVLEMKEHIEKMPITCMDETINITMTFGVEEHKAEALVTELINKADDKLYTGKTGGRNTVVR
ncbi:MAG: GGDEF domain-containing protein [Oscillospiraceae bacterium]|nr:GGDEF domain-containing protein [Oscillospiraceae bacterium]